MENWDSLNSLRRHRTIMTIFIVVLVPLFFIPTEETISYPEINSQSKVIAKSGLKIRSLPNIDSKVLAIVPFNESLEILDENENIKNENGIWCKVRYNSYEGYAWSKYLNNE